MEEAESKDKARKLEEVLTALGGQIDASREPKKQHPSYPINHQKYGYFGPISFRAPTDEVNKLDSQLKLDGDVLRFMLIKTLENPRTMRGVSSGKEHGPRTRKATTETKPVEVVKPEVMDKQLEEVIGNI
jgi:ribosomal protein S6